MFQSRAANHEDFLIIATMPQNQEELFYMFPRGIYPVLAEQLEEVASMRFSPTVITYMGEVAGYCSLYDVTEGQECWLGNVIVHPNYRRYGVGSFLINAMKQIAKTEYKAERLNLICHNTNTKALLFYYKQGFKPFDMKIMEDYKRNMISGIKMSIEL
ncbi:MAG: GNAT family N-acetyltransferase [Sphingobacterium sp.]|jgi:ribosomal protein S18 acetylase RimI-like enzyme|nr:GNAT family N-acetyltransferase [Sphingobacterium sp.]